MAGALVLSLDFELHWGLRDHTPVDRYRTNLLGVREAIPAMLALFERYDVHATWATVGMLFARSKAELERAAPARLPRYTDVRLSPYEALGEVGEDERADPFHFAPTLVAKIAAARGQELASHTFSHYYCLEPGQTAEDFEADLLAARAIGQEYGDVLGSLVFPRNQRNPAYDDVLRRVGVGSYRSNPPHWAYAATADETPARRMFRLLDAYVPLSGSRTRPLPHAVDPLVDVGASAFLRPWSRRLRRADPLRGRRLAEGMTVAAREGRLFHLWWHPHNFGANLGENLRFLERLLEHHRELRARHGFASWTMAEARQAALQN